MSCKLDIFFFKSFLAMVFLTTKKIVCWLEGWQDWMRIRFWGCIILFYFGIHKKIVLHSLHSINCVFPHREPEGLDILGVTSYWAFS